MGAVMCLECGETTQFMARPVEGVKAPCEKPQALILDGQQRLTSMYRALCSQDPVFMPKDVESDPDRGYFYYLDIAKCLDPAIDRLDAVIAVPEDRVLRSEFGRKVDLDVSSREKEWLAEKAGMFPLNIIFDTSEREAWLLGYLQHGGFSNEKANLYTQFRKEVLEIVTAYKLPVITLARDTPKEAVCKVFEHVNTGGVVLTVFELVTASFAADGLDLRKDWEACRASILDKSSRRDGPMYSVNETAFLSAVTLYTTFSKGMAACKRQNILDLTRKEYEKARGPILEGFGMVETFLGRQCVFHRDDLPYAAQFAPLAAICATIGSTEFNRPEVLKLLSSWYWCGVLGEMYGSANDSRYANDITDVVNAIRNGGDIRTVSDAFFSSTRLLTMRTRKSAAYKGVMALICRNGAMDFCLGTNMLAEKINEVPDIHHIFPKTWCLSAGINPNKMDSIVNKTPLLAESNRSIGGRAPWDYGQRIMKNASIGEEELRRRVESHLVEWEAFKAGDFQRHFITRAKKLLNLIGDAMGKEVSDRNSEQTKQQFEASLAD